MEKNLMQLVDEFRRLERKRRTMGDKLSAGEEERLAYLRDYLAQALHGSKRPTERRNDLRVPVSLRVRYRSGDVFAHNYIHNLSRGGVFISTPRPLPLDKRVDLHLLFEDKGVEITVEGKVVWENTQAGSRSDITKPGMGIKFLKMDDQAREVIDELVHNVLEEQARIEQKRIEEENKRKESQRRVRGLLKRKKKK